MKVNDIIGEMADRAFAFSFLQGINDLYAARDYGCTEPDYQAGINHLLTVLTDEQKEATTIKVVASTRLWTLL